MVRTMVCEPTINYIREAPKYMKNYDYLILALVKNDRNAHNALEELYDNLYGDIFAYALSIVKDRHLAEDVAQATFIKLKLNANTYKAEGKGRAWIFRITRNLSLNIVKSSGKYNSEILFYNGIGNMGKSHESGILDTIVLHNALAIIDVRDRQIVMLHAVSGMTHSEISDIMSMPVGTVKWRYSKAIKKLAAIIERNDFDED